MDKSSVKVIVRLRPLNGKEKRSNALPVVTASSQRNEVTLIKGLSSKATKHCFNFTKVRLTLHACELIVPNFIFVSPRNRWGAEMENNNEQQNEQQRAGGWGLT